MIDSGLPTELIVNGIPKRINWDFRDVREIIIAMNDDELSDEEKGFVLLTNLYVDDLSDVDLQEAIKQGLWFLDWGKSYDSDKNSPRILDWNKDYEYICSAVNKSVKTAEDCRELENMHWWTFLGKFAERGKCYMSTILELRDKMARGKKLDKWENEMINNNPQDFLLDYDKTNEIDKELWG